MLTTNIYQSSRAASPPNFGQAGAYSMFLLALVAMLLFFYHRLSRHAHRYQTITGKGYRPRVIDLGRWKWAASALLVAILFLVIGLPLLIVAYVSLQPFVSSFSVAGFARMTLRNYQSVLSGGTFQDTLLNTLVLGTATASIVVPLTALCA